MFLFANVSMLNIIHRPVRVNKVYSGPVSNITGNVPQVFISAWIEARSIRGLWIKAEYFQPLQQRHFHFRTSQSGNLKVSARRLNNKPLKYFDRVEPLFLPLLSEWAKGVWKHQENSLFFTTTTSMFIPCFAISHLLCPSITIHLVPFSALIPQWHVCTAERALVLLTVIGEPWCQWNAAGLLFWYKR